MLSYRLTVTMYYSAANVFVPWFFKPKIEQIGRLLCFEPSTEKFEQISGQNYYPWNEYPGRSVLLQVEM